MRKIIVAALVVAALVVVAACGGNSFTASTNTPAAAGSASTGGAAGGGLPAGGSAGTANGGGGTAGEGAGGGFGGGLSSGGSSGSAGSAGNAGSSAGGAGAPTCADLFSRAKAQLDAASVCDDSAKGQQCTGTVNTVCGCKVPIEKNDSFEAKAYVSTLAQLSQKNCHENCPLIPCAPVASPQCHVPSGSNNNVGICANGVP